MIFIAGDIGQEAGATVADALDPQSLEWQVLMWQGRVSVEPLLPAKIPLIAWLEGVSGIKDGCARIGGRFLLK